MLMRISRRFINPIPGVRNSVIPRGMSYLRSNFVKERKKKTSYLIGREYHFFEIKSVLLTNC